MKRPQHHYDLPLVPEHLTTLTIEKLPFDEAYYIDPDEHDTFETAPSVFVSPDRRLKMSRTHSIDMDASSCDVPMGRIAVMRTVLIDPETQSVGEAFVADLRFLEDHQLLDFSTLGTDVQDQEEFMAMTAALENSIAFAAFVACESEFDVDEEMPKGTFYGSPTLYPALKKLRKRTNKSLKRFLEQQATPSKSLTRLTEQENSDTDKVAKAVPAPETSR